MSDTPHDEPATEDAVEASTKFVPWLIPVCGAVMIFLMAMVAVNFG